jgi:hypothetical protein
MRINISLVHRYTLFFIAVLAIVIRASGEPPEDPPEVARETMKADRHEVVATATQLTDAEARDFRPICHRYRSAMNDVGDELVTLVRDYAEARPEIFEETASP